LHAIDGKDDAAFFRNLADFLNGLMTPISLLAYITVIRIVVGLIALRTSSGLTRPSFWTGR